MRDSDPMLEGTWKARDEHARWFDYNLKKMCAYQKRIEKQSGQRVVTRKPRRVSTTAERNRNR